MANYLNSIWQTDLTPWQSTQPTTNIFSGILNKSIQKPNIFNPSVDSKPQLNLNPSSQNNATNFNTLNFQQPTQPKPNSSFSNWVVPQANADNTKFNNNDIKQFKDLLSKWIEPERAKNLIIQNKQQKQEIQQPIQPQEKQYAPWLLWVSQKFNAWMNKFWENILTWIWEVWKWATNLLSKEYQNISNAFTGEKTPAMQFQNPYTAIQNEFTWKVQWQPEKTNWIQDALSIAWWWTKVAQNLEMPIANSLFNVVWETDTWKALLSNPVSWPVIGLVLWALAWKWKSWLVLWAMPEIVNKTVDSTSLNDTDKQNLKDAIINWVFLKAWQQNPNAWENIVKWVKNLPENTINTAKSIINTPKNITEWIKNIQSPLSQEYMPAISEKWTPFTIEKTPWLKSNILDTVTNKSNEELAWKSVFPRQVKAKSLSDLQQTNIKALEWIKQLYEDKAKWVINSDIKTMAGWAEWISEWINYYWNKIWDLTKSNVKINTNDLIKPLKESLNAPFSWINTWMKSLVTWIVKEFQKTWWEATISDLQTAMSNIKSEIFDNRETISKLYKTNTWKALNTFLSEVEKRFNDTIEKTSGNTAELKQAKQSYAKYKSIQEDFIKSLNVELRNQSNKWWLTATAWKIAWISEILANPSVSWIIKWIVLKEAWEIMQKYKSRWWNYEQLIRNLDRESIKRNLNPNLIKNDTNISNSSNTLDNVQSKINPLTPTPPGWFINPTKIFTDIKNAWSKILKAMQDPNIPKAKAMYEKLVNEWVNPMEAQRQIVDKYWSNAWKGSKAWFINNTKWLDIKWIKNYLSNEAKKTISWNKNVKSNDTSWYYKDMNIYDKRWFWKNPTDVIIGNDINPFFPKAKEIFDNTSAWISRNAFKEAEKNKLFNDLNLKWLEYKKWEWNYYEANLKHKWFDINVLKSNSGDNKYMAYIKHSWYSNYTSYKWNTLNELLDNITDKNRNYWPNYWHSKDYITDYNIPEINNYVSDTLDKWKPNIKIEWLNNNEKTIAENIAGAWNINKITPHWYGSNSSYRSILFDEKTKNINKALQQLKEYNWNNIKYWKKDGVIYFDIKWRQISFHIPENIKKYLNYDKDSYMWEYVSDINKKTVNLYKDIPEYKKEWIWVKTKENPLLITDNKYNQLLKSKWKWEDYIFWKDFYDKTWDKVVKLDKLGSTKPQILKPKK